MGEEKVRDQKLLPRDQNNVYDLIKFHLAFGFNSQSECVCILVFDEISLKKFH